MLLLKNIVKHYFVGDNIIQALRGVNLEFRKSEFVAILGPSGCGKTTLLNIVGGLDRYTSGDLSVNGISTKEYRDADWDSYRNHSIGFVFQTYNLIPHQTVLANVELAMTLSGVSKANRRQHAVEVLKKVGLEDQIHKKPNQLSGGQMQRVAIARALVNDPEIVLADEPTGALDSETSVQIMEILKEIAKDRLVVMVTHNPDLANRYATRIIRLLDGSVINDTNPYSENEIEIEPAEKEKPKKSKQKNKRPPKTSMSFFTALSLSLNNLMTKKTRTFLTAFAGSIGIIGIALILSLSNGVQAYIDRVEKDTLSSYPIIIQRSSMDMNAILGTTMGMHDKMHSKEVSHDLDKIYSNDIMENVINTMTANRTENDLENFRDFIENRNKKEEKSIISLSNDIKYNYATTINIYKADTSTGTLEEWQINPSNFMSSINVRGMGNMMGSMAGTDVWQELLNNETVLSVQFDVIAGRMPKNYNEVVLVVDQNNEITDFTLYSLGLKDRQILRDIFTGQNGKDDKDQEKDDDKDKEDQEQLSFTYDEILSIAFKLLLNTDFFEKDGDIWADKRNDAIYMKQVIENAEEIKVVGILRPAENSANNMTQQGYIGYTTNLMLHLIDKVNKSEVVKYQKDNPGKDIFSGKMFGGSEDEEIDAASFDFSVLPEEQQAYLATLNDDERSALIANYMENNKSESTYANNLRALGVSDLNNPRSIQIYPANFTSKDEIIKIIDNYNKEMSESGQEHYIINYTDFVGLMMSSVSNIINTISLVLIAFVAIALVVSSIMIGIITYISVLERTKEIGILRSIGASKRDISSVFNAETLIIGFSAGLIGIGVTILLCIPANIIIKALTDISGVAVLPVLGGILLIVVSMVLTLIAGLIPSRIAAKKDPVVALRTE